MSMPKFDPNILAHMQSSDIYQSFMQRAAAAQQRAQRKAEDKSGDISTTDLRPNSLNQVPGTGIEEDLPMPRHAIGGFTGASMLATEAAMTSSNSSDKEMEHQIMGAAMRGIAQHKLQPPSDPGKQLQDLSIGSAQIQGGGLNFFPTARGKTNGSSSSTSSAVGTRPPRPTRPLRERSVNNRFKFRERRKEPATENGQPVPEPEEIGGFSSDRFLVAGLPVRIVDNEAGVREWSKYLGIEEEDISKILDLRRRIVRIIEVGRRTAKVTHGAEVVSVPLQVIEALMPRDILLNIAWRTRDIPVPSDFSECVSSMDSNTDPGVEPDKPSEAISMSLGPNPLGAKVQRMKTTPAVGWQGVHDKVLRLVLHQGTSMKLPPDGSIIQGRLLEVIEVCGDDERSLAEGLPLDLEFRLGDGQVCDALECAVARMHEGQLAAICCTDPALVQPGGVFNLAAPTGPGKIKPQGDTAGEHSPRYRILFMVQVLGMIGENPLQVVGRDNDRLKFAKNRKDAGTQVFKSGRIRLARERYRRTANFLSVGLNIPHPQRGSYTVECQGFAKELRAVCWLNAAQCELSLKNYAAAKRYCDAVIVEDPENLKALFRRGSAIMALGAEAEGQEHQAIEDLNKVVARDPNNAQAKQLLRQAEAKQKKRDHSNKDMFKKACLDLVEEFDTIKERLEMARSNDDGAEAEAALRDLAAAMPRLTAAKATTLRFGKCLAELQAQPPGESTAVRELAAETFAEVREIIMRKES